MMDFLFDNLPAVCVLTAMVVSVMLGIADYMATSQMARSQYRFVPVIRAIRKAAALPGLASMVALVVFAKASFILGSIVFVVGIVAMLVTIALFGRKLTFRYWTVYVVGSIFMTLAVLSGLPVTLAAFGASQVVSESLPSGFIYLLPLAVFGLVVSVQNRVAQDYLHWAD